MGRYLDELKAQASRPTATETRTRPTSVGSSRVQVSGVGAFGIGAGDTITFGYLDELYAGIDAVGNTLDSALGLNHVLGSGQSYEQNLARNRGIMQEASDSHGGAFLAGQLAGGAVGLGVGSAGAAKAGLSGLKALVASGAIEGGIYGAGSADGDLGDRLEGALAGAALGLGGSWLLGKYVIPAAKSGLGRAVELTRWGRAPKLATATAGAVDDGIAVELRAAEGAADAGTHKFNSITGKSADEVEEGALFSMKELLGDPGAAKAALAKRLGKLSGIEAQRLAQRIESAISEGAQVDDPHFRSLLGFDVSDPDVSTDSVLKAISIMEDGIDMVLKKAGEAGTRTNRSIQDEARKVIDQGVLMSDLEEALDRSKKGLPDQLVAQHAELYAGVSFVRAKDKFLPLIKQGVEGAREELAEALTKSAHIMAMARGIGSNAGRALQIRKAGGASKINNIADDVFEMESLDEIRNRVNGALKELGDDELTTLMGKLRTAADIERIGEVLTDANKAREWTAWQRTMNSLGSWLRSNALTPATGIFNTISFIGHDFFRNSMAKKWAARAFEKAGKLDDALALRFETEVGQRVYWEAHKRGLGAMLKRIQWEGWQSIEKIAAVSRGENSALAAKARLKQSTMLESGFSAPEMRESQYKPGIGVTDTGTYNEGLAARGGAFARLVNAADRAVATARTGLDELGTASIKLFTGAIDDYGRKFVTVKETYALSARYAIREAMEREFASQEEMLKWAERRAVELAEVPPSEILQQAEQRLLMDGSLDADPTLGFLMRRDSDVDLEATRTLLMDGPQTKFGRTSAAWVRGLDKVAGLGQVEGALMPYINTPIRILERGLVSYNKRFALKAEETLKILKQGGVEAEIEMARIELGTMAIRLGAALGLTGAITVTNGAYNNTANLDQGPPNRLNLPGGGFIEIGRLDPFSLTLSLGAMWGQAINAGYHSWADRGRVGDAFDEFAGTAFFGVRDAILSKSYMTSLQDLMEIVNAKDQGGAGRKLEKWLEGIATRLVPASGTSKQLTESLRGSAVETVGMGDAILRSVPGGSLFMAPRRDVMGDEVKGRTLGISFGDSDRTEDHEITPVKAKLRELGVELNNVSKVDGGVALSADQVSELRRIRGQEATNADGMTMQEALEALFEDPGFQSGSKDDQHDAVVDVMNDFNEAAKAILESRNPQYLSTRSGNRAFREYLKSGLHQDEARDRAREDVINSGLPDPNL